MHIYTLRVDDLDNLFYKIYYLNIFYIMIILFRDSSVNYWLNNSVVDCGNVDATNSNPEIVFPPDDYEIEKKCSDIKENNTSNYNIRPSNGYKKKYNNTNNNKKFEPVYYINDNTSNNSIKDVYIRPVNGYKKKYNNTTNNKKKYNNTTNNKKFESVYYHE